MGALSSTALLRRLRLCVDSDDPSQEVPLSEASPTTQDLSASERPRLPRAARDDRLVRLVVVRAIIDGVVGAALGCVRGGVGGGRRRRPRQ